LTTHPTSPSECIHKILKVSANLSRSSTVARDFTRKHPHPTLAISLWLIGCQKKLPLGKKERLHVTRPTYHYKVDLVLTVLYWMFVFQVHANVPYLEKDGTRILFTELIKLGRNNFAWATPGCRIIHHHESISRRRDGLVKGSFRTDIDDAHLQGTARSWSGNACKGWRKGRCR
jgi:hypothetical protein